MTFFEKISTLLNSNINHALDKAQDPLKIANLMVQEMEQTLTNLKTNLSEKMVEQKSTKRNIDIISKQIEEKQTLAKKAIEHQQESEARSLLGMVIKQEKERETLHENSDLLDIEIATYNEDLKLLVEKIKDARSRLLNLRTKLNSAQSKRKIGKTLEKARKELDLTRFDLLENQINRLSIQNDLDLQSHNSLKEELVNHELRSEIESRLSSIKNS